MPLGGSDEVGLTISHAQRLDGDNQGEFSRLALVFQDAQIKYCLGQQLPCVGPRAKLQQEVKRLPKQSPLCDGPSLHR